MSTPAFPLAVFARYDARPPCSNALAALLVALAAHAAAAPSLPGGLPDPVATKAGGAVEAPADRAAGGRCVRLLVCVQC